MNNVPTMNAKGPKKRIMVSIVMYVMSAARAEEKLPSCQKGGTAHASLNTWSLNVLSILPVPMS